MKTLFVDYIHREKNLVAAANFFVKIDKTIAAVAKT